MPSPESNAPAGPVVKPRQTKVRRKASKKKANKRNISPKVQFADPAKYQVIVYVPKKPTAWGDLVKKFEDDFDPYSWDEPTLAAESTSTKFWLVFLGEARRAVAEGFESVQFDVPDRKFSDENIRHWVKENGPTHLRGKEWYFLERRFKNATLAEYYAFCLTRMELLDASFDISRDGSITVGFWIRNGCKPSSDGKKSFSFGNGRSMAGYRKEV